MLQSTHWRATLARLFTWKPSRPKLCLRGSAFRDHLKLLVVLEGVHDIAFLRSISAMLHAHDPKLPDLGAMEHRGELVFVPSGGGDFKLWAHRLAPLGKPEFHLYDREEPPETELRQQLADSVNARRGCLAVITSKRSLENYLHPAAIREDGGVGIEFDDDADVADLIARQAHARQYPGEVWQELPRRKRTRRRNRVKQWLNRSAARRMTPERLAERDPQGEVRSWLEAMGQLIAGEW